MAYTWTQPNTIDKYELDDNYVIVTLDTNHKLRCKKALLKPSDYAFFYASIKSKTPVKFGAFVPWNPYEWFITWESVEFKTEHVIVNANRNKELIKSAIKWASKHLELNKYEVEKALIVSVGPFAKGAGTLGYAKTMSKETTHTRDSIKVTKYTGFIAIKEDQLISDVIRTLFHELVHFKQYISGELMGNTWMGQEIDTTKVPYALLPWEVEAWSRMDIMLEQYLREVQ